MKAKARARKNHRAEPKNKKMDCNRKGNLHKAITIVMLVLLTGLFFRVLFFSAWLCDDAYITFRSVYNFVHGFGLCWNIDERVQSFTHPLWFFFLSFAYYFTREIYYTSLYLSLMLSFLVWVSVFLCYRNTPLTTFLLLTGLLLSRAFIDYSTSGLENPLSHLLLVIFFYIYQRQRQGKLHLFCLTYICSLGMLTRLDLGLICLPPLLYSCFTLRDKKGIVWLFVGFSPLFLWLLFSLFYYGFPFPNTAYAKLGTGIPVGEYCIQGIRYLQNSIMRDPLTLILIIAGILTPFLLKQPKYMVLSLGVVLYLVYIIRIGGDFMSGRLLTPPLLFSVLLLGQVLIRQRSITIAFITIFVIVIGLSTPNPTITNSAECKKNMLEAIDPYLIADERSYYYPTTGLAAKNKRESISQLTVSSNAKKAISETKTPRKVVERGRTGFSGYSVGPDAHIIDLYALSDPLLARLPAIYKPVWRVGHFWRHSPKGYKETLISKKNRIEDPDLAAFYDHLTLITRGPLFSLQRIKTIFKFNLGCYNHLVNRDNYRFPDLHKVQWVDNEHSESVEASLFPIEIPKGGLQISFSKQMLNKKISVEITGCTYYLLFLRDSKIIGNLPMQRTAIIEPGMETLIVPENVVFKGFNAIRIMPVGLEDENKLVHFYLK